MTIQIISPVRFPVDNRVLLSFEIGRLLNTGNGQFYECAVLFANTVEDFLHRGHTFDNAADLACNEMIKNEDLDHFWDLLLNSVSFLCRHWIRASELWIWYCDRHLYGHDYRGYRYFRHCY
ncbi:MAG: hypothetical protein WCO30_00005 [bacterium]